MRVEIDGLTKRYGAYRALQNVSMTIESGQIVAVLGANGAGKTTLLRCLATIAAPSAGSIHLDGEPLSRGRLDLRQRLFFLPDFPFLFAWPTPVQHIGMVLRLYGKESAGTADRVFGLMEALDLLGCGRAPIASLSRGQTYKTALAALLAVEPELVLLDEPFASGMDPQGTLVLKEWARRAAGNGTTLLYTTQILEVAEAFSDKVAILHRGGLHAFDSVAALREQTGAAEGNVLAGVMAQLRETGR
jgi:ABC-type multidrug transport system ATPase subunit